MKNVMHNFGYFLKETMTIMKINLMANIFSILSIGLILLIFLMSVSGEQIISNMVMFMQEEAEISVYYNEDLGEAEFVQLIAKLKSIDGVYDVSEIDEDEAYKRMTEIMGENAQVLKFFNQSPFSPFIEMNINLDKVDIITKQIENIDGVEYVGDNKQALDRLKDILHSIRTLGGLLIAAIGISTLVIISHIIRQAIYNNKEQIDTLRLLGAPEKFIVIPFLFLGIFLTICGGLLASTAGVFLIKYIYPQIAGPLPFIPLPTANGLIQTVVILTLGFSLILGCIGSFFGLIKQ